VSLSNNIVGHNSNQLKFWCGHTMSQTKWINLMKAFLRLFWVFGVVVFCFGAIKAAPGSSNQPAGFRLIVELQDGSKIIGKNGDDNFQFYSDVLGEMKLPLERIRAIVCQPKTNSVQLTTVNGDILTAQFVTKVVRVQTAFGGVKLPVNLIRCLTISPAEKPGQMREGLVALWSGEGNGNDPIGGCNATLTDVTFARGMVGQAFFLNGIDANIRIAASPILDTGLGGGMTIEAWINPATLDLRPILEWNQGGTGLAGTGVQLWLSVNGPGEFHANVLDTMGNNHHMGSARGVVIANSFQHVALTYDKTTGEAVLYRNCVAVATQSLGIFTPQTSFDLYMGVRPSGPFSELYFQGMLDEVSLYNRALTAPEIQADYEAGKSGK
jgi:hypothetical protein